MLIRSVRGYICDQTGDQGDSANRAGIMAAFGNSPEPLLDYVHNGICARSPEAYPWTNSYNFSRDQMIPFMAGLNKQGHIKEARQVFWRHAARCFFAQNLQRDIPGSWKFPWPHDFINDKGEPEHRPFDFADPLLPNDIWHMIKCAKLYPLYWFGIIGIPVFILAMYIYCQNKENDDDGQVLSQCLINGDWALKLFKKMKPWYQLSLTKYWTVNRNQKEICDMIINKLESI
jgi:hypothetical protein